MQEDMISGLAPPGVDKSKIKTGLAIVLIGFQRARKQMIANGVVFLVSILLTTIGLAEGSERTYYSIHLASFKYLQNANRKVNSLKQKEKMVFWKKTNVPGKGNYYRVFLGKYKNRDEAVSFWEKLNQEGAVSYFGVYEFKETNEPQKNTAPLALTAATAPQPAKVPIIHRTTPKERFVDNHDGTITDNKTNLMWIKNGWRLDFVSALTWEQAAQKCKKFKAAGYTNWRLSSIEEWKTLIDAGKQAPAIVDPNPFENIIIHMPYWSHTEFAFGKSMRVRPDFSARAYTVMLYSGRINHQKKAERAFVLPVRSVE